MKYLKCIIVLIIFSFTPLVSQTIYQGLEIPYDSCSPCSGANITYTATAYFNQPNQVASDFGPRYVKREGKPDTPYDWHGGIDYNGLAGDGNDDKGYRLRAIVGGTIHTLSTGSLKFMVIDGIDHDFGYLHMFVDGTPSLGNPIKIGDCQYVLLDKLNLGSQIFFGILVPHNGQQRLLAVCPNNDCSGKKYTIPGTQTPITATNQLAAGDIIGELGTSGRVGAHLHLNRYESLTSCTDYANCDNYMLNPLEHIEHTGVNYACMFHNHSTAQTAPENESEGFSNDHIVYPGTKSSPIMIRPQLNGGGNDNHYTAGTFNIRDVSLEINQQVRGIILISKVIIMSQRSYWVLMIFMEAHILHTSIKAQKATEVAGASKVFIILPIETQGIHIEVHILLLVEDRMMIFIFRFITDFIKIHH